MWKVDHYNTVHMIEHTKFKMGKNQNILDFLCILYFFVFNDHRCIEAKRLISIHVLKLALCIDSSCSIFSIMYSK